MSPEDLIELLPDRIEKALTELLTPGETIHVKLKGAFKEGLVCTDMRVMVLKGGFMAGQVFGNNAFQLPYSNVSGVQVVHHLVSGYFELSAGGMQNTPKSYWSSDKKSDPAKAPNCISLNSKRQREKFLEACAFILSRVDQVDSDASGRRETGEVFKALERLGILKESGVLSEDEFNVKKEELLKRL